VSGMLASYVPLQSRSPYPPQFLSHVTGRSATREKYGIA
jgi:hypothetical protein